jgi:hypothetical protein
MILLNSRRLATVVFSPRFRDAVRRVTKRGRSQRNARARSRGVEDAVGGCFRRIGSRQSRPDKAGVRLRPGLSCGKLGAGLGDLLSAHEVTRKSRVPSLQKAPNPIGVAMIEIVQFRASMSGYFTKETTIKPDARADLSKQWSDVSPDAGSELCQCSWCGAMIGHAEDDLPWEGHIDWCAGCHICEKPL